MGQDEGAAEFQINDSVCSVCRGAQSESYISHIVVLDSNKCYRFGADAIMNHGNTRDQLSELACAAMDFCG